LVFVVGRVSLPPVVRDRLYCPYAGAHTGIPADHRESELGTRIWLFSDFE
jgi:hypothetical protein